MTATLSDPPPCLSAHATYNRKFDAELQDTQAKAKKETAALKEALRESEEDREQKTFEIEQFAEREKKLKV